VPAKNENSIYFLFTRTLIVEFPNVPIWAQHPVINRPWNFIHALEKRRRVIVFRSECEIRIFFLIFTGWRNSIASSSRECCLKPRLRVSRVFMAAQEVWNEHLDIRCLYFKWISNLYPQIIWDFMVFEGGIFTSKGYMCIKLLFNDVMHAFFIKLSQNSSQIVLLLWKDRTCSSDAGLHIYRC